MSTHCKFFRTGKPMNSTLQPEFDASTDWEVDCNFFEPFDVLSPEILLRDEGLGSAAPPINPKTNKPYHIMDYNYVYIQAPVERYYWINKWERISGIWHAYTTEDVLASFKDDILKTNQYVLRTSRPDMWDDTIPDTFYGYNYKDYTVLVNKGRQDVGQENRWISTANKIDGRRAYLHLNYNAYTNYDKDPSATDTYVVRYNTWNCHVDQLKWIFHQRDTGKVPAQDNEGIQPIDYILEAYYLPVAPSDIEQNYVDGTYKKVYYGNTYDIIHNNRDDGHFGSTWNWFDFTTANGVDHLLRPLRDSQVITTTFTTIIPNASKNIPKYQFGSAYRSLWIKFSPFGLIQLNSDDYINETEVKVAVDVDLGTGEAILYDYRNQKKNKILATTNIKVNIPVTSYTNNGSAWLRQNTLAGFNIAQGTLGVVTSGIAGGIKGAAAGGVAGAIAGAALGTVGGGLDLAKVIWSATNQPPIQSNAGVTGSVGTVMIDEAPTVIVQQFNIVGRDDNRFGRPICQNKKLSDLAGYFCLCQNAIFGGAGIGHKALATERAAIESALNGGVYLE